MIVLKGNRFLAEEGWPNRHMTLQIVCPAYADRDQHRPDTNDNLKSEVLSNARCARENCYGNSDRNLDSNAIQAVVEDGIMTENIGDCDVADLGSHDHEPGSVLALVGAGSHDIEFGIGKFAHDHILYSCVYVRPRGQHP